MKAFRVILASLAVTAAALAALAAPAQASYASCPAGTACVDSAANGGGSQFVISYSNSGGLRHCVNFPPYFDNVAVSGINGLGSNIHVDLFSGPNCNGETNTVMWPGSHYNWYGTQFMDVFSSWALDQF